ncbi:MAG: dihydropteroate synthase [Proteobacteria bacterium]|nr:MAG: dihydropteroate synthase [Pseudomonadota bacterium]
MTRAIYTKCDQPLIMGILNVTPDSFSDGGQHNDPKRAVAHALEMVAQGADIIDVGGESTRPGADTVDTDEQLSRVIPVISALRDVLPKDFPISIDTTDSEVARLSVIAGVNWLNDISAAEDSPDMLTLAANHHLPIVLMHRQGKSATMQDNPHYEDVCGEVFSYLSARADEAIAAGVPAEHVILDPGIGFGKRFEDNLELLANLSTLCRMPYPVLLGTSRKRFLSAICKQDDFSRLGVATAATTALAVHAGVRIVRVHDVLENRQAADVAWAICSA